MFFLKDLPTQQMVTGYLGQDEVVRAQSVLTVLHKLRSASLLIRRLDEYFQSHGLSQLRFLILVVIDREPEHKALTASEIAQRLDVSKPVLSRTLDRLSADGMIAFSANQKDFRKKEYHLLAPGKDKLSSVTGDYLDIIIGADT
jgi:DNA-binding MarR family transcriptional regulator